MQNQLEKVEVFHIAGDWIKKPCKENESERVIEFKPLTRCWLKYISIVGFPSGMFRINMFLRGNCEHAFNVTMQNNYVFKGHAKVWFVDSPHQVKRVARLLSSIIEFDNDVGLKALKEVAPEDLTFNEPVPDKINLFHNFGDWNVSVKIGTSTRRSVSFYVTNCKWLRKIIFIEEEGGKLIIDPTFTVKTTEEAKALSKELEDDGVMVSKSAILDDAYRTQAQREAQNMARFLQRKGVAFVEPEYATILQQFADMKTIPPAKIENREASHGIASLFNIIPERRFGKTFLGSMLESFLVDRQSPQESTPSKDSKEQSDTNDAREELRDSWLHEMVEQNLLFKNTPTPDSKEEKNEPTEAERRQTFRDFKESLDKSAHRTNPASKHGDEKEPAMEEVD